jgi:hypothetical protein
MRKGVWKRGVTEHEKCPIGMGRVLSKYEQTKIQEISLGPFLL